MLEGVQLMGIGMTTVFAFLGLLVLVMHGSAWFFRANAHLFPEPELPAAPRPQVQADDHAEIAVVLAAIAAHRSRRS